MSLSTNRVHVWICVCGNILTITGFLWGGGEGGFGPPAMVCSSPCKSYLCNTLRPFTHSYKILKETQHYLILSLVVFLLVDTVQCTAVILSWEDAWGRWLVNMHMWAALYRQEQGLLIVLGNFRCTCKTRSILIDLIVMVSARPCYQLAGTSIQFVELYSFIKWVYSFNLCLFFRIASGCLEIFQAL